MIATFEPLDSNRWRQLVARDIFGSPEAVSISLTD
jgi:hypothetical protein